MSEESAAYTVNPAPTSSVQIEGRQKGPPVITVKVYAADVDEATRLAVEQYDALVTRYSQPQGDAA